MREINLETKIEDAGDPRKSNIPVKISITNNIIWIGVKGYGTPSEEDEHGYPIGVESYNGKLRVILWDDINVQDPKVISMESARETNRRDES